jgi:hypothetical protein
MKFTLETPSETRLLGAVFNRGTNTLYLPHEDGYLVRLGSDGIVRRVLGCKNLSQLGCRSSTLVVKLYCGDRLTLEF